MGERKAYKYFTIVETKKLPATSVYSVFNNRSGTSIGTIKWYPVWRQYCFFPIAETVFSKDCLNDISGFIKEKMDERMTKK